MLKLKSDCAVRPRSWLSLTAGMVILAAATATAGAQSFDVRSVPRPEGSEAVADREQSASSITYVYGGNVGGTVAATEKALNAGGWKRYRTPDEERATTSMRFKNGRQGIYVHFTMSGGKSDRSQIYYSHNNSIIANVVFPDDATDIVYDENRPYLRCLSGLSVDDALDYFTSSLTADGWTPLTAAAIATRWPNAKPGDATGASKRAYFAKDSRGGRQPPVMLTLQRDGAKTVIDLRIAPFALPQELPLAKEFAGFPSPERTKSAGSTGSADSIRREAHALVIAELPVVLAFYRREMPLRGWTEQSAGASISDTAARITFTKPDDTAVLELGQRYDLVTARITAQVSPAAIAAREKAKKDADAKWMQDAMQQAKDVIAASEAKRAKDVAAATAAPVEKLAAMSNPSTPIPLPDNAIEIKFDGNDGKLDFNSPSTPRSVATFYRDTLKPLGWKEDPGVINGPTMYSLDFKKGAQKLDFTVMLFGGKAKVSVSGTGLQVPADPTRETVKLEGAEAEGFPVPKNYTMSSPGTVTMSGSKTAFRKEFNGKVPADIGSVLAFYRRELGKRSWKEQEGAVVKPDTVVLAYAAPDGPAQLMLGRDDRETTIKIVVKNPAEAAKADALPPSGMSRVVLGNISELNASVTINQKTIKVPQGAGKERPPKELVLDLKPGKYRYVVKVPGKRDVAEQITLGADDTWALLIGPGGVLPLQMY